jgi:hypothetical protein
MTPWREGTIIWVMTEEAPNVEVVDTTFAISGHTAGWRDVMASRALTQTNQHQSLSVRTPLMTATEEVLEVGEGQRRKSMKIGMGDLFKGAMGPVAHKFPLS